MQLTPEQQQQVRQAKANGERRVRLEFTPDQKKEWQEAAVAELAGKEANIAHFQKLKVAAEQPGIFGDIRRAMLLSRRSTDELSAVIGVDQRVLSEFRAGEAELPAASLDRLVDTLGLRLMQEIPR